MLTVSDRAAQDVGTLVQWDLISSPPVPGTCDVCQSVAGVADATKRKRRLEILPNHPNPFSRTTQIRFALAHAGHANLRVFDVAGQTIATLVDGELSAGPHVAIWDGTDQSGRTVPSGLYFYRLSATGDRGSGSMLLLR